MAKTKDDVTPSTKQYLEIKNEYKEYLLFYRVGDFYELFFDDAHKASKALDIVLTHRGTYMGEPIPMCGVPFHAADTYLNRLVQRGFKVAICEQVEDPKTASGLVKRDVVRVVTPGTLMDTNGIAEKENNFFCLVYADGETNGIAFADASTGEMYVTSVEKEDATEEERKLVEENIQNIYDIADTVYERSKTSDKKVVIMLDELLNVKPAVQSLVYTLVLNRMVEIGKGLKLPDNVVVVATGNQKKYSSVAEDLAEPLEKRFDHILDMEPKVGEWITGYAIPEKIHPAVIGYMLSKYNNSGKSENIDEEDIFTVWDYKGINIIEKGEIKYQKILNYLKSYLKYNLLLLFYI